MRKTLQIGTICLLVLLYFNLASVGATGKTSLNLHKQTTQDLMDLIPTLFHQEADKTKGKLNALTKETELVVELEKLAVITELKDYQKQLENEIAEVEKDRSFLEKLISFEKEKKESVSKEINTEVTEYLEELLNKQ